MRRSNHRTAGPSKARCRDDGPDNDPTMFTVCSGRSGVQRSDKARLAMRWFCNEWRKGKPLHCVPTQEPWSRLLSPAASLTGPSGGLCCVVIVQERQRCLTVAGLGHKHVQHLALMMDHTQEEMLEDPVLHHGNRPGTSPSARQACSASAFAGSWWQLTDRYAANKAASFQGLPRCYAHAEDVARSAWTAKIRRRACLPIA